MGRGVSAGGGQSSLGYLFGSGEAPKPGTNNAQAAPSESLPAKNSPPSKPAAAPQPADINKQVPAGINSTSTNNYLRADGQNTGNFITELSQRHKYTRKDAIVLVTTKLHFCCPRRMNNTSGSSSSRDRPSTKVHAAPGGGSSLGYLFGGGSN
ncbi:hypothetical protein NC652_021041 [Populus alba x Populus x berolinensis]|nr:hypothetical protein NC651_020211 [Populus alba x Populus x berolinensis]KAJ6910235.1 hypothetical protein NC652_021041 [Populus alba x Populus x berolinensis]